MEVDRKDVIESLGGEAAVKQMGHEARADALEDYLSRRLDKIAIVKKRGYPTVAELESKVDKRGYRRGAGKLFIHERSNQNPDADDSGKKVPRLAPMPDKPTLIDFFKLRFPPAAHLLQSARLPARTACRRRSSSPACCTMPASISAAPITATGARRSSSPTCRSATRSRSGITRRCGSIRTRRSATNIPKATT